MPLPKMGEDTELGKNPIQPLSVENETQVLVELARLAQNQLDRYPTTLEEDQAVIASNVHEFGSNRRNSIVVLRGEKEVCHHYVKLASIAVPLLTQQVWCL